MRKLKKLLGFVRLIDEFGQLSLTNIAVVIVLVKIALQAQLDLAGVTAVLTVLSGYNFKRYVTKDSKQPVEPSQELETKLKVLEDKLGRLELTVGMRREDY